MGEKLTVKQYRLIKGYTQKEVASRVGLDVGTVAKIENNIEEAKVGYVKAICKFLGVSIDDIFFGN